MRESMIEYFIVTEIFSSYLEIRWVSNAIIRPNCSFNRWQICYCGFLKVTLLFLIERKRFDDKNVKNIQNENSNQCIVDYTSTLEKMIRMMEFFLLEFTLENILGEAIYLIIHLLFLPHSIYQHNQSITCRLKSSYQMHNLIKSL